MAKAFFEITLLDELDDQAQPIILEDNPAGILDHEITYPRHQTYGTIFRNFGDNLRFVKDGAEYNKGIFNTHGIDGECSVGIKRLVNSNKTYEPIYNGIIDYTTYLEDDTFVEAGIIDSSTMAKFLARENTAVNIKDKYNLDNELITNDVGSSFNVELPAIKPIYWANGAGETERTQALTTIPVTGGELSYNDRLDSNTYFNNIGEDWNNTTLVFENNLNYDVTGIMKFDFETLLTGSIDITLINPQAPPALPPEFKFIFRIYRLDTDAVYKEYELDLDTIGTYPINYTTSDIGEINSVIADGESQGFGYVFLISNVGGSAEIQGSFSFYHKTIMNSLEFQYFETAAIANTRAQMYKPLIVGNLILERMGIDTSITPFKCEQFETGGEFEYLMLTNGKGLRQYPADTPINISFREFFEGYSNMLGMLMFYDGTEFRMGTYDYFYDESLTGVSISEVSNLTKEIAADKYFSRIKVGYKDNEYDYLNGSVEFNTEFTFSTVNKNTTTEVDKISEFTTASLSIELIKRKPYLTTGSEDDDDDNKIFVISSIYDFSLLGWRAELGSDFTATGLRGIDRFYNLRISPKSNLVRHGFLLNTTLTYQDKVSKYISSNNNIPLVIDGVAELSSDYLTAQSGSVKPVYYTFDTILTDELINFLKDTPNNKIIVSGVGTGFLINADINIYKNTANIKMIQYS